ncbi:MAG: carbon-nitrogen hydrolase family protein [Planctomycetaceae bacterium]
MLIALPELFNCLAEPPTIVEQAEVIPGPTSETKSNLAAELQVTLVAGSIAQHADQSGKVYNTSLLFGPDGCELARYRKIHLFDIDLPGQVTFQESALMVPGDQIVVTETAIAVVGQATCYDLRFPELFRSLVGEGANVFVIPSAFTMATGRDHWQVLLQARAIENQVYLIAPNQFGRHTERIHTYGHSMIIDPWGTVLAAAPDGEGMITAEIDFDRQAEIRSRLPCLNHRREFLGK